VHIGVAWELERAVISLWRQLVRHASKEWGQALSGSSSHPDNEPEREHKRKRKTQGIGKRT
jgi:hypothetical protein